MGFQRQHCVGLGGQDHTQLRVQCLPHNLGSEGGGGGNGSPRDLSCPVCIQGLCQMGSNVSSSAHILLILCRGVKTVCHMNKMHGFSLPTAVVLYISHWRKEKKKFPLSSLLRSEQANSNKEDQLRGDKTCEQPKQTAGKHQGEPSPRKGRGDARRRKSISAPGGRRPTDYECLPSEASNTHTREGVKGSLTL